MRGSRRRPPPPPRPPRPPPPSSLSVSFTPSTTKTATHLLFTCVISGDEVSCRRGILSSTVLGFDFLSCNKSSTHLLNDVGETVLLLAHGACGGCVR